MWKEHFARQITVAERTVMKTFQSQHLTTGDVAKIAKLSDGKFDDTVLYRLVSALSTSFESYNPDNTVMVYLKQHSQALRWEHKFDFRPLRRRKEIVRITNKINLPPIRQIVLLNGKINLNTNLPNPNG